MNDRGVTVSSVLVEVGNELNRQVDLKAIGKFDATAGDYAEVASFDRMLTVLTEEVGEVARAVNDKEPANMRKELIQVAAVAVSAVLGFDEGLRRISAENGA